VIGLFPRIGFDNFSSRGRVPIYVLQEIITMKPYIDIIPIIAVAGGGCA